MTGDQADLVIKPRVWEISGDLAIYGQEEAQPDCDAIQPASSAAVSLVKCDATHKKERKTELLFS